MKFPIEFDILFLAYALVTGFFPFYDKIIIVAIREWGKSDIFL